MGSSSSDESNVSSPADRGRPSPTGARRSTRSKFILPLETLESLAKAHLHAPKQAPDGHEEQAADLKLDAFQAAVHEALLESFTATEELRRAWVRAQPIALGSWSRGELCPKSDLDLLFAGDEDAAAHVTRLAQEAGIKIRSRIPEDRDDWTKGVAAFDVLALLTGRPLTDEAARVFETQIQKLQPKIKTLRRSFLSELKKERADRTERFDSIANFLEPNLKFGPGALRDLGQALQLRLLFPERYEGAEHALHVFDYYRRFFLLSRIRVQLSEGGGDLLSAYEQAGVAEWFGYEHPRDFMREIQKGLSRVSFYADVDFERARASEKELRRYAVEDLSFPELSAWLEKEPTVLVQARARETGFKLYRAALRKGDGEKNKAQEALGRLLGRAVDPLQGDAATLALFRSRWIDLAVTDFKKIVGYVQHDQYHRYTVDAHLMQAVREMKRVAERPTILGRLAPLVRSLTKEDWKILGWSALYHDVGKGSGGDHSDKSVEIARQDLPKWGVGKESLDEIVWLIENHLELSVAAFRGNPAHPSTWRMLHAKGIEGKRLLRLAIFTAVDIRATNREAYTPWKERLLFELVQSLEKPEAKSLSKLEKALEAAKEKSVVEILDRLDPFLVSSLPTPALAKDLAKAAHEMSNLKLGPDDEFAVKVLKISKSNRVWIRFHVRQDRPGLFARMTRALQAVGLSVRHASILSDAKVGVYDWFEVKPPASLKGLETKLAKQTTLSRLASDSPSTSPVNGGTGKGLAIFDEVDCIEVDDKEWVLSFRGKDTRGALLAAAEAIANEGLSILWAKVHTWGRQIDDVFGVVPREGLEVSDLLRKLKARVGVDQPSAEI